MCNSLLLVGRLTTREGQNYPSIAANMLCHMGIELLEL